MKTIHLFFLCLLISGSLSAAWARSGNWVETDAWFGRGAKTTRMFQVAGQRWRLLAINNGTRELRLRVFNRQHEGIYELRVPANSSSIRTVPAGSGEYYLRIDAGGGGWEGSVRQHISRIQEWRLREEKREFLSGLGKTASFSGDSGSHTYTISIPSPSWRMVYSNSRDGRLEIRLKGKSDAGSDFQYTMKRPTRDDTWIHHAGEYELRINARDTRWRIDFYGPESSAHDE